MRQRTLFLFLFLSRDYHDLLVAYLFIYLYLNV